MPADGEWPAIIVPAQGAHPNIVRPSLSSNTHTPPGGSAAVPGWGFAYAPFRADGNCKSADDIKKDFAELADRYRLVRIYGTSCNQVANVLVAAQKYDLKIFAGIFDINQVEQEAAIIIAAAKNDWNRFETISVGNELVNSVPDDQKGAMVDKVISAVGRARSLFNGAGYKGNIVTVDTLVASRAYPALCSASDYCAVNCHPFFDGSRKADEAGMNVTSSQSGSLTDEMLLHRTISHGANSDFGRCHSKKSTYCHHGDRLAMYVPHVAAIELKTMASRLTLISSQGKVQVTEKLYHHLTIKPRLLRLFEKLSARTSPALFSSLSTMIVGRKTISGLLVQSVSG